MLTFDIHTHTIASGHGTRDTISDMAKEAAARGLSTLGISDHSPATPGAASLSYFRSLPKAPQTRFGIRLLYGAEANILEGGLLDIPDDVLKDLDFCIVSMHRPPRGNYPRRSEEPVSLPRIVPASDTGYPFFVWAKENRPGTCGTVEENTMDYIRAMQNPHVHILGHCDNTQFPVDYVRIADAAAENHMIVEVNNASLTPGGYHQLPGISTRENYKELLSLCQKRRIPVLISSDTHGRQGIGRADYAEQIVRELSYPEELIVNMHPEEFFMRPS
ncbi:MAG: PHP domain-containing protein [Lachnospiraceae bacterium]|nr:PHP domain-containing protein [Lachnospiraceae bacterium]